MHFHSDKPLLWRFTGTVSGLATIIGGCFSVTNISLVLFNIFFAETDLDIPGCIEG